jgi:hypothetical protein
VTPEDGLLGAPYRAVRVVRAPQDGPWPGTLVSSATGESVVLVDAAVLGPDWWGWQPTPGAHVVAPIDLVRRPDGHDVALPVIAERLDDFLRRRSVGAPLSDGECVTLAVSVLRGCAQVAGHPEVTGEWWLDADGMPLLATDASERGAFAAAAELLRAVPADRRLRGAWDAAIAAITADRVTAVELEDAEDALFAAADAEPLLTTTLSPRRAAEVRAEQLLAAPVDEPPERSAWQRLLGHADSDLADTVSRATTAVWRRWRTRTGSRRAPLLVGGAAAAIVLVGGALWPSAGGVATGQHAAPTGAQSAGPPAGRAPTTSGDGASGAADDGGSPPAADGETARATALDAVTATLLDRRAGCGDDQACLAGVLSDPGAELPPGAIDLPAPDRVVTLLDDFGGVAVLRVDAVDGSVAGQLLVVTRRNGEWLLRDVQDVAQQP